MKRINYRILCLIAVVAMAATSCKKEFLDRKPPNIIPFADAVATESDMASSLRGAYAGLRAGDYYGRSFPVFGDLVADNGYVHTTNTGRYIQFNTLLYNSGDGNISGFWNAAYSVILRCNNIINAPLNGGVNVAQYKGEAYAIRALAYFDLVRYFAKPYTDDPNALGVPLVLTYDPAAKPGRAKVSEVYAQIISDLTAAYGMMTLYTNSTQFSKYAARGLQAKVYLYMNDKANAKTAALDVINNGGFTLVTTSNFSTYWNGTLPRTDKLETLMEVSADAIANNGFDGLPNIYSQAGYGDIVVSSDLNALFLPTDIRKQVLYPAGTHQGFPVVVVNKYPNVYGTEESDRKVLRLSEMYLIAAEASLPADEPGARTYVNAITSRRNADPIVSSGAQLFEDIITERRKELAFEGDRFQDLNRLKRDIIRSPQYPNTALTLPYSNFRRLFPIPVGETDANATIKPQQNPGY
ncbi:MAG: RagB/SusD family nutrient uptake outer membrane protein [Chitinophagaceae bacterium]|nr:RagB/SusD family nutrient uptake outer membrane protein [Chitinophagaceae bacterium]